MQTDSEVEIGTLAMVGSCLYRRINHDRRVLQLLPNGMIGEGRAAAERCWSLDSNALMITGDFGVICELSSDPDGVYRGRWKKFEQMEIELTSLRELLRDDPGLAWEPWLRDCVGWGEGCAVDVGANSGVWTRSLAKRYRKVIAIEPQEGLAKPLQEAGIANVEVLAVAAWCCPGRLEFDARGELENSGHSAIADRSIRASTTPIRQTTSVEVLDLDCILRNDRVDFIKIDTEGTEVAVLGGLEETIRRDHPRLVIESHSPENSAWLHCYLERRGYEVSFIRDPYAQIGSDRWYTHCWIAAKHLTRA